MPRPQRPHRARLVLAAIVSGGWLGGLVLVRPGSAPSAPAEAIQPLAAEVRDRGWIAFSAKTATGDWDLFACRPDGTACRNLTGTPAWHEFAPQFARDSTRLLYRRLPRSDNIDANHYGSQGELVVAERDASNPRVLGGPGEWAWASWSPDGRQVACLSLKGITFSAIATGQELRRLDRRGFFQQLTWSPDGRWLVGVANAYGTGWSVARLNVETGETSAIHRVDCCTPDWFPDSQQVVFSWRPPGQKTNGGQGWTQLWMADAEGRQARLLYGEDGRHVYGGHVSPDGQYVLFTGNMQEDGDPGRAGAPMALMRVRDGPIIGGESADLRALHPAAKTGPVLALPAGWEPCWTSADLSPPPSPPTGPRTGTATAARAAHANLNPGGTDDDARLAAELHDRGRIVFSAKTEAGDWDLFTCRPDGSERRPLTDTREFSEAGPRFSPDGRRLLYYRLPRGQPVNMSYGTHELVIADADGRNPVAYGADFPWASWGPDSTRIACLRPAGQKPAGIQIVDLATRKVIRQLPDPHIVQQLVWSPDGQCVLGTANHLGEYWNIGRLNLQTGVINAVSETDRYNCTPDWAPDSQHIVYARGIDPAADKDGRAEMWWATDDGQQRQLLFAEGDRHIYGACVSPDGDYCLFTRSQADFGHEGELQGFTLAVMRRRDAPLLANPSPALRKQYPKAKTSPWLDLGPGWEPHWTFATPGTVAASP